MVYTLIVFVICAALCGVCAYIRKKNVSFNYKLISKILVISLLVISMLKAIAADGFTIVINGGEIYGVESDKTDIFESIIRCGLLATECLIFTSLILDNKSVKWILSRISLPFITLSLVYFYFSVSYFTNPASFGMYFIPPVLAAILLTFEYAIVFAICLGIHLFDKAKLETKEEKIATIKLGIISQLVCIPFLVFGAIFGSTSLEMSVMSPAHIGWIVSIPVVYCVIYFLFKNENKDIKLAMLAVMCFFLMIHMTSSFKVGYQTNRLPLQLCNLAPYIFVLLLFVRKKSLFNWIYVANPVGAIVAVFTLADRDFIFCFWMIHYLVEHLYVFIIPILFVTFGVFERPSIKQLLKDYFIWFSIYFGVCLLFNCIHNGLVYPNAGIEWINDVNFFYLLDCPVKDVLPFYSALEFIKINLFGQEFFLGYIGFIYVVFSALSFLLYYIQEGIFKLTEIIKNRKTKVANN
ncbi:MAG: YwaF family protein [Bacilli bacterium]|nr:YwaF family protein [Bacilli bacterium]